MVCPDSIIVPAHLSLEEGQHFNVKALQHQLLERLEQLKRQIIHTSLAQMVRDTPHLETLTIQWSLRGGTTLKGGISLQWRPEADEKDRSRAEKHLTQLRSRVPGGTEGPFMEEVFAHLRTDPAWALVTDKTVTIQVAPNRWEAYLRQALGPEGQAHYDRDLLLASMAETGASLGVSTRPRL